MKIEQTFLAFTDKTTAYKRVKSYFMQKGYKQYFKQMGQNIDNIQALAFKCSSNKRDFFDINPEKWNCDVELKIMPFQGFTKAVNIKVLFNIERNYRTIFTDKFWESEIHELEKVLSSSKYTLTKKKNIKLKAISAYLLPAFIAVTLLFMQFVIIIRVENIIKNHFNISSIWAPIIGFALFLILLILLLIVLRIWIKRKSRIPLLKIKK